MGTALEPTLSVMAAPGTPPTHPAAVITILPASPPTISAVDAKVLASMTSTPRTTTTTGTTTMATDTTTTVIAPMITHTLTPSETVATSSTWLHPNADSGSMDSHPPIPLAALAVADTDHFNESS